MYKFKEGDLIRHPLFLFVNYHPHYNLKKFGLLTVLYALSANETPRSKLTRCLNGIFNFPYAPRWGEPTLGALRSKYNPLDPSTSTYFDLLSRTAQWKLGISSAR